MSEFPNYAYNASAIGLGGVIRRNGRTTVIPTVASVCLAAAGGEASNRVDYYDRDGISFTRAETTVRGYSRPNGAARQHQTVSEVTLLNLRIFDRISIGRMYALVESVRDLTSFDPNIELTPDRTQFTVEVEYEGVEVDGEELAPVIDAQLCSATLYSNFQSLLNVRRPMLLPETVNVLDASAAMTPPVAPVSGPLVSFPGNANAAANRVGVPAFGRAAFGDLIVKPDRQRVSLLRLNLDELWSPSRIFGTDVEAGATSNVVTFGGSTGGGGGALSGGDSGSNGVPIWP